MAVDTTTDLMSTIKRQLLGMTGTQPNILGPVVPVLKTLCMIGVGFLLAQARIGVLNPLSCKLLSKLVFALFFPCLIFTELGKAITPGRALEWWFIPVNVVLSAVLGCLAGLLVALICRPPPQFFRFTVVMTGIGNTGNLPLSIVGSVCHGWNPFGSTCKRIGIAYVSFATFVSVVIIYGFVYHMLEPPPGYVTYDDEAQEQDDEAEIVVAEEEIFSSVVAVNEEESMPDLLEAEWPGVKDASNEQTRTPFLAKIFRRGSFSADDEQPRQPLLRAHSSLHRQPGCLAEPRVVRKMRIVVERTPIRHMLQPPTVASLLAIVVGSVSAMRSFVLDDGAPLEFFTDALTILGNATVPCALLVLGGMFSGGPAKSSELGVRTTVGICIARLLLLPALGIGVVVAARKLGLTPPGDRMFHFVLLLQHSMPSSILMAGMTSLRGFGEREASSILFWQHIVAVVPLSAFISLYLVLVHRIS